MNTGQCGKEYYTFLSFNGFDNENTLCVNHRVKQVLKILPEVNFASYS